MPTPPDGFPIASDGLPSSIKWFALCDSREGSRWVTLRCPHQFTATLYVEPESFARLEHRGIWRARLWGIFAGHLPGEKRCRNCSRSMGLHVDLDLAALVQLAIDRPEVAVYRSVEELVTGAAT